MQYNAINRPEYHFIERFYRIYRFIKIDVIIKVFLISTFQVKRRNQNESYIRRSPKT